MRAQDLICKCLPGGRKKEHRSAGLLPQGAIPELKEAIKTLQETRNPSNHVLQQLQQVIFVLEKQTADDECSLVGDVAEVVRLLLKEDVPMALLENLQVLDFQTRTTAINFCCVLLQLSLSQGSSNQVLDYFCERQQRVFDYLCAGCANEEVAPHAGIVLQSCLKYDQMVKAFLDRRYIFSLLKLVQHQRFEISTDAFSCLREVLVAHKVLSSQWLLVHFDEFFREYEIILDSGSYVVQRQALALLSELLLDRICKTVMLKYVSDDRYLRTLMNLLRSHSRTLQFETFQLFKLFVANPNKPIRVRKILTKNQLRLIGLIDNLQPKSSGDDDDNSQFFNDKKSVIDKLQALVPEPEPLCLAKVKISVDDGNRYSTSNVSTSASSNPACHTDGDEWHRSVSTPSSFADRSSYTDVDDWAAVHLSGWSDTGLADRVPLPVAHEPRIAGM